LGRIDEEDCSLRPVQAKSQQDLISTNKLCVVVHACNLR
jgi:hypothetical protein